MLAVKCENLNMGRKRDELWDVVGSYSTVFLLLTAVLANQKEAESEDTIKTDELK